jgi:glycosyltransferase 2 family protein
VRLKAAQAWYNSRRLKRILQVALIVALTIFLLWLFLRNADFRSVWAILRSASPAWLALAVLANLMGLVFRTVRWRILLDRDGPPPFYATLFANSVGYMLSTMLPIRAADVTRPALLSWRTPRRFSGVLGTVLMERILDLGSLLLLFGYFTIRRWSEYADDPRTAALWNFVVRPSAVTASLLVALLITLLTAVYVFGARLRRVHAWLSRFLPARFRDSWMHFFDSFVETTEILKRRRAFARVLLSTGAIWFCLTSQVVFAAIALDRPLTYDAVFFLTAASMLGFAVPTPGGIGGMHKVAQFVLTRFYGFDIDSSVAAAVLFHLVGTLPVITVGLVLFLREGLKWKDVTRKS